MKRMYKSRNRAWVRALRSGKFPQTQGTLCKIDEKGNAIGYCCLGVLCELAVKDGVEITVEKKPVSRHVKYGLETGHLPLAVMQWAGLTEQNPIIKPGVSMSNEPCDVCGEVHGDRVQGSLTASSANDDAKLNFDQIADLIQENL